MRIVHVADSFAPDIGGIERQVEALAMAQRAQGHDVTVITAVNDPADLPLHVVRALPGRWLTVCFPWRNRRLVHEVLDAGPIDVVHAHFSVVSPIATYVTRLASRRGIPVAATVHSIWWQVTVATRLLSIPFGYGQMRAAWSGVSRVAATHVSRTLPRSGDVSVVPNLIDSDWWRPQPPVRATGDGQIRIVLVGRLKKRKHVDEFLDVLGQVRTRLRADGIQPAVAVDIVGSGPRRDDLQKQIDALGLADWVTLLGHRNSAEIRELLHRSDLFIAASRQESFGIAAFEARSAGLPVLGYQHNGLVEFIEDGLEGVLVPDAAGMVEALHRLLADPAELERLRKYTVLTPPRISPESAMADVYALYERARAMHGLRAPERVSP
ncbi:MAG TPA: glycosyltransferase family 4 protein [Jatrophihabitans sp.]|nr:glycosyltransferase family 4 protein [Jatrophihabitans sp.]